MNINILPFYLIAIALLPNAIKETLHLYQRLNVWYNRPKTKTMPKWSPRPQKKGIAPTTVNATILGWKLEERRREGGIAVEPVEKPACLTTGVHPAIRSEDTSLRFKAVTGKL